MRVKSLNLASQPFANERPAKRTTIFLSVLALMLLAVNVFLYQRHWLGQHEQRQTLETLLQGIANEEAAVRELEERLAEFDVNQQNREVVFLNAQIARRAFSWSDLFDHLGEVLPMTVQLNRLTPKVVGDSGLRRARYQPNPGDLVAIELSGVARSGDAVLEFLDALFAHPSFSVPNLSNERLQETGLHEFSLSVFYQPSKPAPATGGGESRESEETLQDLESDSVGKDR